MDAMNYVPDDSDYIPEEYVPPKVSWRKLRRSLRRRAHRGDKTARAVLNTPSGIAMIHRPDIGGKR